jgi:hypothetical protein
MLPQLPSVEALIKRRCPLRNVHMEALQTITPPDRLALWITVRVGSMAFFRATVLCAGLASAVAVLGCAAQQRPSMPTDTRAANGLVAMPLYDETAYYNAVKNRWLGWATTRPTSRTGSPWNEAVNVPV